MKHTTLTLIVLVFVGISASFGQKDGRLYNKALEFNNIGYEQMIDGEYELAKQNFIHAMALDSTNSLFYINLKDVCERMNDTVCVRVYLEKAKNNLRQDDEIYYYSGNYYQDKGDLDQAIADYSVAIDLVADDKAVQKDLVYAYYFNRANSYFKLKRYEEASQDFTKTIELDSKHYGAYTNRGISKYYLKDREGACQDWHSAFDLGFYDVGPYINKYCDLSAQK